MKKIILLFVFTFGILFSTAFAVKEKNTEVMRAYDLRMSGKVDEARTLLESLLEKDPANAMAWYELARVKHYMFVGGGTVQISEIQSAINNAVKNEPDNVTYAYYNAVAGFLSVYYDIQTGKEEIDYQVNETCDKFKNVLKLKPDYYEAMLYLVEIYSVLPQNKGGNPENAEVYFYELSLLNKFYSDKAQALLAPKSADMVKYWQLLLERNTDSPEYLIETGKACLMADDIANAEKCFSKLIGTDPMYNTLILDMARFHILKVMKNPLLAKDELPKAKVLIESYLSTTPAIPFKAFAIGLLARIEMVMGNPADSDKHTAEALALDKYFSRATGLPTLLLFVPPDQISQHYFSFFTPY